MLDHRYHALLKGRISIALLLKIVEMMAGFSHLAGWETNDIYQSNRAVGQTCPAVLSGDFIEKATPVPIPNTVVKLFEPMIVYTNAKVGIAGLFKPSWALPRRVFLLVDSVFRLVSLFFDG
jgi:hypothetical protein